MQTERRTVRNRLARMDELFCKKDKVKFFTDVLLLKR